MGSIKIMWFVLFMFLLSPYIANSEIYSAKSIEEINNTILELVSKRDPQKTVLLLPLENFLLKPVAKEFYIKDRKYIKLLEQIIKQAKLSKSSYFKELVLTEYEHEISDSYVPAFIKNIQNSKIPIIVFTTNCSGSFNNINYLEVWTWKYLFDRKIDLSLSPIGEKQFIFDKYHRKVKGTYPTYYKGLLSCDSLEGKNSIQSVVATLFAIKIKSLPDVIYVVHREENFIKALEKQFKTLRSDIQVEGFIFSPQEQISNDLSLKVVENFWSDLVKRLNKVSRKEKNVDEEDPYEQ